MVKPKYMFKHIIKKLKDQVLTIKNVNIVMIILKPTHYVLIVKK